MSIPSAIPASRSSGSPIPSRCLGASGGSSGAVIASTPCISGLSRPRVPPIASPSTPAALTASRRFAAQVLVDTALDDPEHGLLGRAVLAVPVEAAVEPAVGALGRARGVVAVGVEGRALVEGERDVGAELRLHVHRLLRPHEPLRAVEVGAEAHPALGDLEHTAAGPGAAAPALDLVGDPAVREREDLKAARVGDQRAVPADEPVQAAELGDPLGAGRDEQVEGVAEDQLEAEPGDVAEVERPHRPLRRQRDERGRRHRPVRGQQAAGTGGARRGRRSRTRGVSGRCARGPVRRP